MAGGDTPHELLRAALAREPGRPFVTFYDDATGERVELSVATFENWVAKTAGLLRDGLSAAPGDRVGLLLPPHWQAMVWAAACWAIGASVVTGSVDDAAVAVVGPDDLDAARAVPEAVALSLRPLGGRFTDPLPAGVLDYAAEVPSYPDRLVPYVPPGPNSPALHDGSSVHSLANLVGRARLRAGDLGLENGARVLVASHDLTTALGDALLVPLVLSGSSVLVRNEAPDGRDGRVSAERVTAILG